MCHDHLVAAKLYFEKQLGYGVTHGNGLLKASKRLWTQSGLSCLRMRTGYTLGSFDSVACARPNLSWHLTDQKESCPVSYINRLHYFSVLPCRRELPTVEAKLETIQAKSARKQSEKAVIFPGKSVLCLM